MVAFALSWCLLLTRPGSAAGVGETVVSHFRTSTPGAEPTSYHLPGRAVQFPDTTKKPVVAPDSARALQPDQTPAVLEPDDSKLTRKSTITIVAAIAVLTLTTLLLYNVRSR